MRIVNPTFGTKNLEPETEASQAAKQPLDWRKDKIVLFSNSKPNAKEVLEGLNAKIDEVFKCGKFDFTSKGNAAIGATNAHLDEVASKYRGAILASGDWGACSSWSLYDYIELQKRGVRTYLVITEPFRPMVMAQAKARGIDNPRLIVIRHPIGGLNAGELVDRIEQAGKSFFEGLETAAE